MNITIIFFIWCFPIICYRELAIDVFDTARFLHLRTSIYRAGANQLSSSNSNLAPQGPSPLSDQAVRSLPSVRGAPLLSTLVFSASAALCAPHWGFLFFNLFLGFPPGSTFFFREPCRYRPHLIASSLSRWHVYPVLTWVHLSFMVSKEGQLGNVSEVGCSFVWTVADATLCANFTTSSPFLYHRR